MHSHIAAAAAEKVHKKADRKIMCNGQWKGKKRNTTNCSWNEE